MDANDIGPLAGFQFGFGKQNKIHISQKLIGNTVGEMTRKRRMTNYLKAYKHTYAIMQTHACVKRCSCDFITHLLFRAQLCTTVRMHNSDSNSHAHRSFYFYALCQPSSTMREYQVKWKSKKKIARLNFEENIKDKWKSRAKWDRRRFSGWIVKGWFCTFPLPPPLSHVVHPCAQTICTRLIKTRGH